MKKDPRGEVFKVRLPLEEKLAWQCMAKEARLTLSDLVRTKMGGATIVNSYPKQTRTGRKADPLLISNIARVGSNLNQIARWANTYKSAADAGEILLALIAIEQQLRAMTPVAKRRNKSDADAEGQESKNAE